MTKPDRIRRLGQHFLADQAILSKIVQAAAINRHEIVCEVGTGRGELTGHLCRAAKDVVSYEVDMGVGKAAAESLSDFKNLELRTDDAFRSPAPRFDVFVSNLPYSRSRDAIEWLSQRKFKRAIIMIQQEFADKLCAAPGSHEYKAVSALSQYCFMKEHLFTVPKEAFEPEPKVLSLVMRLTPSHIVEKSEIKQLNLLFSSRNRLASSVAKKAGVNFASNSRVFQLDPPELFQLARIIKDVHSI